MKMNNIVTVTIDRTSLELMIDSLNNRLDNLKETKKSGRLTIRENQQLHYLDGQLDVLSDLFQEINNPKSEHTGFIKSIKESENNE